MRNVHCHATASHLAVHLVHEWLKIGINAHRQPVVSLDTRRFILDQATVLLARLDTATTRCGPATDAGDITPVALVRIVEALSILRVT